MNTKTQVLIVNEFHGETIAKLDAAYDTHHLWKLDQVQKKELISSLQGKCTIAATASWNCDPIVYELLSLKLIACFGVGVDGIDFQQAHSINVKISNTPGVLNDAVADLALAMILSITRNLVKADAYVRSGDWASKGAFPFGEGLQDKTLGILGMGRIGEAIASRAQPFGMPIAYHNRSPKPVAYPYFDTPLKLAEHSDILVCVLPGGIDTKHVVDLDLLKALGPKGYFINVGRGSSVNETDLASALSGGNIAGAALDVYDQEPLTNEHLLHQDNLILLPHIGSSTAQTRRAMGDLVIQNIDALANSQPLITEFDYK
jgi:lactate dehydrogenase-like 2-hydroxyacid dehydrogenase